MFNMIISPIVIVGLCCLIVLAILACCFYSPKQYKRLKELYDSQIEQDNAVYNSLKQCTVIEKLVFRFITKDVGHYL